MTREETQDILAMIQGFYPNFNPPDKTVAVNAWTAAMAEYSAAVVSTALISFVKTDTSGFAPAPGQLIELIHNISTPEELNEMEAWSLVSNAIRRSIYHADTEFAKLPEVVQAAVGSASQLRVWAMDENYSEPVVMSQFLRTCRTEVARKAEWDKLPEKVQRLIENVNIGSEKAKFALERQKAIRSTKNRIESRLGANMDVAGAYDELTDSTITQIDNFLEAQA